MTDTPPDAAGAASRRRPWFAALLLAAAAAYLLPIFLRMPRWCDTYFYDAAAASVLRGDLLYREHLLYGAPGMPLLQAAVRAVLGWSDAALRGFDAAVLGTNALLLGFAAAAAAGRRMLLALAAAVLYTGLDDSAHGQPDHWMLAPALGALLVRQRRWNGRSGPPILEGALWGLACALKPFPAVAAAAMAGAGWLAGGRPWRTVLREEALVAAGAAASFGAGLAWVAASGNWPHYRAAVAGPWTPAMYQGYWRARPERWATFFDQGWPWTATMLLGGAGALWEVAAGIGRGSGARAGRALLGGLCLGWLAQAHFLQAQSTYHLAPALLLCLGVCAGLLAERGVRERWLLGLAAWTAVGAFAAPAAVERLLDALDGHAGAWRVARPYGAALGLVAGLAWSWGAALRRAALPGALLAGGLALAAGHPWADRAVAAKWPRCWRPAEAERLLDELTVPRNSGSQIAYGELRQVRAFLRGQGVADREVDCFAVSALPLYIDLQLRTPHRYLMPSTAAFLAPGLAPGMVEEIRRTPPRFVVGDTQCPLYNDCRRRYGYPDGPVVFRAGRYEVRAARTP